MKSNKNILIVITSIFVFVLYFIWPYIISGIAGLFSLDKNTNICLNFIYNIILLLILVLIYSKSIKHDFVDFKNNFAKHMLKGLKILIIGLLLYVIMNGIISLICSFNAVEIDNFNTMYSIFKQVPIILLFSTIFYYPIVEEIVFKRTFKEIITNKWCFIIVTGLLNAGFNMALASVSSLGLLYIIPNTIFSMTFSYIYYETNNLITTIVYRALYNLIPNVAAILTFIIIM